MKLIWRLRKPGSSALSTPATSMPGSPNHSSSNVNLNEKEETSTEDLPNTQLDAQVQGRRWWRPAERKRKMTEKEKALGKEARNMKLYSPFYTGLSAGLAACKHLHWPTFCVLMSAFSGDPGRSEQACSRMGA